MRPQVFSASGDLELLAVWDCAPRSPYGLAQMPGINKLAITYVDKTGMGGVMTLRMDQEPSAIPQALAEDAFTTGVGTLPHGISADGKGDLYVAYTTARRVERWQRRP